MSSRGRAAKVTAAHMSVKQSCTIMAAFDRQKKKKDCPVCKQSVFLTLYRAHLDRCQLRSNDSDCEILAVLTGDESRALHAGPSIVLDDDEEPEFKPEACKEISSSVKTPEVERRRSRRIKACVDTVDEIEIIEVEEVRNCKADPENCPPDTKRAHTSEDVYEVVSTKRTRISSHCSSPLFPNRTAMAKEVEEEHVLMGAKETRVVSADEIVKKIERLLSGSSVNPSPQKTMSDEVEQSSQTMESKRIPYIVKFTLLMMRRVLLAIKSDGTRYDESFWQRDIAIFDRYAELSPDMQPALVQLVSNGFVDSDRSLVTLEEALKVAPLPVIKTVAKMYQLDTTKGKIELTTTLTTFSSKQKGLFGQVGTVAVAMLKAIKKELGSCYRVNRKASELFKALFTLYAPTEMCSSLAIDQPSVNISQTLL
ncbi:hypothetical protein COOONC_13031 [Cooperia oncophora]